MPEPVQINKTFLDAIVVERVRQRAEEGWTLEHDDTHSVDEWVTLLTRYIGRMADAAEDSDTDAYARRMVQVGAILLAQAESFARAMQMEPRS